MDPLFERRELSRKVHLNSKFIKKNIENSLLAQLKMNYEGKCSSEGFIKSLSLLYYSMGRSNYRTGGVDYNVQFQADICLPHPGQTFKALVNLRSKIGIHADCEPLKVLIPRDLHIGNEEFENIKEKEEIEFEVVGSEFKQEDKNIYIMGRLKTAIKSDVLLPLLSVEKPKEDFVDSSNNDPDQKTIKIVPNSEPEKQKRKLKRKTDEVINEQTTEGTLKGTD
jgi:DNA-directed RNA polymerase subunit E'/Rpb7